MSIEVVQLIRKCILATEKLPTNVTTINLLTDLYLLYFKNNMSDFLHNPLVDIKEYDNKQYDIEHLDKVLYSDYKILKTTSFVTVSVIFGNILVKATSNYQAELDGNKIIYRCMKEGKNVNIFTQIYGYLILNGKYLHMFTEYLKDAVSFRDMKDPLVLKRGWLELMCNYINIWDTFSPDFVYSDLTKKNVVFVWTDHERIYHFKNYDIVFPAGWMIKLVDYTQVSLGSRMSNDMFVDMDNLFKNSKYSNLSICIFDETRLLTKYFGDVIEIK